MRDRILMSVIVLACTAACERQLPVVGPDDEDPAESASTGARSKKAGAAGSKAMTASATSGGAAGGGAKTSGVPVVTPVSGFAGRPAIPDPTVTDSKDDTFDGAIKLKEALCTAPPPEVLAMFKDVRALTLAGDTLVFGTADATYTLPKTGGTPSMLSDNASFALAVLGEHVYYSDAVWLHALPLPGAKSKSVIDGLQDSIDTSRVFSDGKVLLAGGADFRCEPGLHVFGLDGKARTIAADCPKTFTARNGNVYAILEVNGTPELATAGPTDTTFKKLFADERMEDNEIAATDRFIYFTMNDDTLGHAYLSRIPVAGGKLEVLTGFTFFNNLVSDGTKIYFYGSTYAVCGFVFDETTGKVSEMSGEVAAYDDKYLYSMYGGIARSPR